MMNTPDIKATLKLLPGSAAVLKTSAGFQEIFGATDWQGEQRLEAAWT